MESFCASTTRRSSAICEKRHHLSYAHSGKVVPKCVICDDGSILGVQFFSGKLSHYNAHQFGPTEFSAVFETARGAKFDPEYLCTGSTCTANILQFKTTVRVLVNRVRTSLTAYTCPPKDGANLAKKSEFTVFAARDAKFQREYLCTGSTCAADVLQFKTSVYALVKSVTISWPAYRRRPTKGANLAKNSHVYGISQRCVQIV